MRKLLAAALAALFIVGISAAPAYAATSTLSMSLDRRVVTYDSAAWVSGLLRSSSGAALAGRTVYLTRGGSRVRTLVTDSRGRIRTPVNYLGTAVWRLTFPGDSRYAASKSPELSTYPALMLNRTYTGEYDGFTYTTERVLRLAKGHTYQIIFDHPAVFFLGTVAGYESTPYLVGDTSGKRRIILFKPPWTTDYWAEWDWGGGVGPGDSTLRVTIW